MAFGKQWRQLDHMLTICTSLQTTTPTRHHSLTGALPDAQLSMPECSILKFSEVSLHMCKEMIYFINITIIKLISMFALQ